MSRVLSILRHPSTAILLGAALAADFLAVSGAFFTHGCIILSPIPVIQTPSGLAAADDDPTPENVVGHIHYSLYRGPRITGPWAGTQRVFDPSFTYMPADGATPTPAELTQARAIYANAIAARFGEPEYAAAVRAATGPVRTPFIAGYIHNSVALATAAVFLASVGLSLRAQLSAAREADRLRLGQCPACSYLRTGLSPETPCPECGTTLYPSPCAASSSTP